MEVNRRTDVVGVFPIPAALLRSAGAVLVKARHEWQVSAEQRYLSEHPWPWRPTDSRGGVHLLVSHGMIKTTDPHGA